MIPPVSVCHQLSWMGSPNASIPQRTASGFRGSPTLAMNRRSGHGCSRASVGASSHHHPDGRRRGVPDRTPALPGAAGTSASASKSASSTTLVTPSASGARMPYDIPVTQPGSAVHQNTSSSWRSSAQRAVTGGQRDRFVHVDRSFGRAGRATREVEQRHVVRARRGGRGSSARRASSNDRRWSTSCRCRPSLVVDDDHVAEAGERTPDLGDLAPIEGAGGDQHAGVARARGAGGSAPARTRRTACRRRCRASGCRARRCTARGRAR